ncbi:hypothetical protein HAX54_053448 [Datura stramonium]|uniref:Uncharacterized protein n=1 Tax=Datura stramonium TaxID=4076 RepID=A0ABS8T2D5_DATST|nr:hypothetical protein [Datura stramonium]
MKGRKEGIKKEPKQYEEKRSQSQKFVQKTKQRTDHLSEGWSTCSSVQPEPLFLETILKRVSIKEMVICSSLKISRNFLKPTSSLLFYNVYKNGGATTNSFLVLNVIAITCFGLCFVLPGKIRDSKDILNMRSSPHTSNMIETSAALIEPTVLGLYSQRLSTVSSKHKAG